ncbi:MAG: hypothetical protein MUC43_09585 [Pirellula sp.]|jgi:hypothetical protein|nr:hypothetical protein [Pirellula sp.]
MVASKLAAVFVPEAPASEFASCFGGFEDVIHVEATMLQLSLGTNRRLLGLTQA